MILLGPRTRRPFGQSERIGLDGWDYFPPIGNLVRTASGTAALHQRFEHKKIRDGDDFLVGLPAKPTNHPPYGHAENPVKLPIAHMDNVRTLGQSGAKGETRLPDLNFSVSPFGSDVDGPFLTNRRGR